MHTYRVDKMDGVTSMKAPRHAKEVFEQVNLADYTQYTFSMYAGKPEKVTLLFDNGYLAVARDRFGYYKSSVIRKTQQNDLHFE